MNDKIKEILSYVIIIVLVLLIKLFVVTPIKVNGDSMNNTLENKDIMILDRISYRFTDIKRFDIVVINKGNEHLIKRVIALPGEQIKFDNNKLYINGLEVKEYFDHLPTEDYKFDEIIPENYYFVVGDNRVDSLDSRYIGLIKKSEILGKTNLVIFPFSRFGIKK